MHTFGLQVERLDGRAAREVEGITCAGWETGECKGGTRSGRERWSGRETAVLGAGRSIDSFVPRQGGDITPLTLRRLRYGRRGVTRYMLIRCQKVVEKPAGNPMKGSRMPRP